LTKYWVFLLDRQGTIRSFKALECANDQDALEFAREAFARAPQCRDFELWQENRRIHPQMTSSADRVASILGQAGRQR
jgi:1,2-phenylacetyl-CoA epoxidase PaaB subunit